MKTPISFSVDSFIAYASLYSSDFRNRIEGASEQDIAHLEELCSYSLPDVYRHFLQRMGNNAAGMTFEDCNISLRAVISYYKSMLVNPRLTLPAGCLLIGAYGVDSGEFCLDMNSGADHQVLVVTDEDETEFYATSLLALLYHTAFYNYRLTSAPHEDYVSSYMDVGQRNCRSEARQLAEQLGFAGQWFDEAVNFHGEGRNAGLYFSQPQDHGLSLRVTASTLTTAQEIGNEFVQVFGLKPAGWQ